MPSSLVRPTSPAQSWRSLATLTIAITAMVVAVALGSSAPAGAQASAAPDGSDVTPITGPPPTPNPELLEPTEETLELSVDPAYLDQTRGLMNWLVNDVHGYWDGRANVTTAVNYRWIPRGSDITSSCGPVRDVLAAYCSRDDHIYFSETFAVFTLNQFGDGALAYVMAHEYAHNVQSERGRRNGSDDDVDIVVAELHSDCLAGAYLGDLRERGQLEEGDYREAQTLAVNLGDDDHGSGIARRNALHRGFLQGAASCWDRWELPNVNAEALARRAGTVG